MQLTSSAFAHNTSIPALYTCDGRNISPPLTIAAVPQNTACLVLLMEDPDVPKSIRPDGMWDHWVVFNIPPTVQEILEGENPEGVLGVNTRGNVSYGGPCPPDQQHRYFFKIFSLDVCLEIPPGSTKKQVEDAMHGHVIEHAELVGLYKRK